MKLYRFWDGTNSAYVKADNVWSAMKRGEIELVKISGNHSNWYEVKMIHSNVDTIPAVFPEIPEE